MSQCQDMGAAMSLREAIWHSTGLILVLFISRSVPHFFFFLPFYEQNQLQGSVTLQAVMGANCIFVAYPS